MTQRSQKGKGTFWNRPSLKAAVDEWLANETSARAKHGDIAGWDQRDRHEYHVLSGP